MPETQEYSHKKTGALLLALFGVLAVVFGTLQIRNTLYGPFALKNTLPIDLKKKVIDDNTAYLSRKDTDSDTLSDFDELNVYGTSPYQRDTFSYGMSDAEVVKRGLPLCGNAGKNCSGAEVAGGQTSVSSSLVSSFQPSSSTASLSSFDFEAILNDPKQLRQILLESGKISAKELGAISDADLIKVAKTSFAPTSTPAAATSTAR